MSCMQSRAVYYSVLQNEEDVYAIENVVRGAIDTIMKAIYNVNRAKMQEYQKKVAEKDKENETLQRRLEKAERKLIALRRLLNSSEGSGNECFDVNSLICNTLTPEIGRKLEKPIHNPNEMTSGAEWNMESLRLGARTPSQVPLSCQDTVASEVATPDLQNITLHPSDAPWLSERTRSQSPSLSPVTILDIKQEPPDMESSKWETYEENLGEEQQGLGPIEDYEGGTSTAACSRSLDYDDSIQHMERSTIFLKRKLTCREKLESFRGGLCVDPERQRPNQEKELNKYQKVRISELPDEIQKRRRAAWREATRRFRARKKAFPPTNPAHRRNEVLQSVTPEDIQRAVWTDATQHSRVCEMSFLQSDICHLPQSIQRQPGGPGNAAEGHSQMMGDS